MSRTRFDWTVLDFAIFYVGGVTVPIYETSSTEQVKWILEDSGSRVIFVETPQLFEVTSPAMKTGVQSFVINEHAIDHLCNLGKSVEDSIVEERISHRGGEDLATLIYTSGTTGLPKGVEISHANFFCEAQTVVNSLPDLFLNPTSKTLLFLPLAHVFGRMIEIGALWAGLHVGHTSDIAELPGDLSTFQPTFILAVPRIFEKVFNAAALKAQEAGKEKIFNKAIDVAVAYSQSLDRGKAPWAISLQHSIFSRLVYKKILAGLGGNVTAAISGGAPLSVQLGHFYRGIGISILEGYGLTETTAGICLNLKNSQKMGSVGRPLPGVTIKIDDDGEVLAKGDLIMKGYWHNEEANNSVFTSDGFFRTGDLGHLDSEGFLTIVGRKKELIVTSGGKNVSPSLLEDSLRNHSLISQVIVIGDNKPFISALITLDPELLTAWVRENKKEDLTFDMLHSDKDLHAYIQIAIDECNAKVSRAESIRKFYILPHEFTIANGELTAKMSIKRKVVEEKYADVITSLYDSQQLPPSATR
jgi:long-chain acyl-CoA synthetase